MIPMVLWHFSYDIAFRFFHATIMDRSAHSLTGGDSKLEENTMSTVKTATRSSAKLPEQFAPEAAAAEMPAEQTATASDGRGRDTKGRFAPGKVCT
jgi:hypothetical protein